MTFYIVITNLRLMAQKGGDSLSINRKSYHYFFEEVRSVSGFLFLIRDNYKFMITGIITNSG